MMIPELPEIIKVLGIGSGTAGIAAASYFIVQHIRVKENSKKIDSLISRCDKQDTILAEHTQQLTDIKGCTKNIDKNVEKLIKLHLKA